MSKRTPSERRKYIAYIRTLRALNAMYLENIQRMEEAKQYAPDESIVRYSDAGQLDTVLKEREARAGENNGRH